MVMVMDIPHCLRQTPGCWWHDLVVKEIVMKCPECGQLRYLDHDVAADGVVDGPVRCRNMGCTFNRKIRLADYKPFRTRRIDQ